MRRRRVALGALLLAVVAASTLYVATGLRIFANYRSAYGPYSLACNGMLAWDAPSALYIGLYDNQTSLVTVQVRATTPILARVTVEIPGIAAPQVLETQAGLTFQPLGFKPRLLSSATFGGQALAGQAKAQLVATAQFSGRPVCRLSTSLTVYGRQWIRWRDGDTQTDLTPFIAGWVTPQAPAVTALVGRAAQRLRDHPELYDTLPALFGYENGQATPEQARDQVNAIFDTLQSDYHIHYSADNPPFTTSASQIVQAPDDILGSVAPSGMCVETTVIMASAVERLGMRPYIVFTSTHAYLGVALSDAQGAPVEYWETSDLNGATLGAQANVDGETEYASDLSTHAVTDIVDIAYERARGIEPNH